jgi:hypothetical protein
MIPLDWAVALESAPWPQKPATDSNAADRIGSPPLARLCQFRFIV